MLKRDNMGFFHQLRLLLWKNLTLKKRSPVSTCLVEFICWISFLMIISPRKRELVAFLFLNSCCPVAVSVVCLFLVVPWLVSGLQFPGHTLMPFGYCGSQIFYRRILQNNYKKMTMYLCNLIVPQ